MKKVTTTTVTTTTVTTETKPTQIVMVLDRSGSMESIAKSTVDGINSFIKEQKAVGDDAFMTLIQFDHQYETTFNKKPIGKVQNLINGETFVPRGTTALYDAIGKTISDLKDLKDDVIFVIVTDGQENASKEYTQDIIFNKIEEMKKSGWNFIFLGANQDSMKTGSSIGINTSNSINYNANARSVDASYNTLSAKIGNYRSYKSHGVVDISTLDFNDNDRKELNV